MEKFPAIGFALKESVVEKFVLDGEVVALDENGVPDFQELQNWRTTKRPIVYYVFDVLYLDSKDLLDISLGERREILQQPTVFQTGVLIGTVNNALSTTYSNITSGLFLNDRQFTGGNRKMQLGVKLIW